MTTPGPLARSGAPPRLLLPAILLLGAGASAAPLGACGGARPAEAGLDRTDLGARTVSGGARVLALTRSTPGLFHLALFVDAGAADASPPQVATLSAWRAAEAAGREVSARVTPDATSFEQLCEADELRRCAARAVRALCARGLDSATGDALRARLADARRRAATDAPRAAQGLALAALLGDDVARGLVPLGDAAGDASATDAAVEAYLTAHYGPSRALFVAVGDVDPEAFADAVSEALDQAPAATSSRAARRVAADPRGPAAQLGEPARVAIAALAADLSEALALGRALEDGRTEVHAFELRGGAVVLASRETGALAQEAEALSYELERARVEQAPDAGASVLPADPALAARRLGQRWTTAGERRGDQTPRAQALGAVVPEAGADGPTLEGRVAALREAAARGLARAAPAPRGHVGRGAARVVLDNGTRITVRRRPSDHRVAIAVRFGDGASEDPPAMHGRAALAAVLSTTACEGLPAGALGARLEALEATATPIAEAHSFGMVLEAPGSRWREALDLAWRCARVSATDRGDLERARLLLVDRLDDEERHAAWAALALAPGAPGSVAPWGTAESQRDVSAASLERFGARSRVGARAAVAIVGDVPVDEAVARAARRWAGLVPGSVGPVVEVAPAEEEVLAARAPAGAPRALVAFHEPGPRPFGAAGGARAFAARLARALAEQGVEPLWAGGDAGPRGAWAAVALRVPEERLSSLPGALDSALAQTRTADPSADLLAAERARRLAEAQPGVAAARLSREALGRASAERGAGAARAVFEALGAARHRWVIARPPPR